MTWRVDGREWGVKSLGRLGARVWVYLLWRAVWVDWWYTCLLQRAVRQGDQDEDKEDRHHQLGKQLSLLDGLNIVCVSVHVHACVCVMHLSLNRTLCVCV